LISHSVSNESFLRCSFKRHISCKVANVFFDDVYGDTLQPIAVLAHLTLIPCVQVTNPAIDPLREGLVMSLEITIGKRGNLLEDGPHKTAQV